MTMDGYVLWIHPYDKKSYGKNKSNYSVKLCAVLTVGKCSGNNVTVRVLNSYQ